MGLNYPEKLARSDSDRSPWAPQPNLLEKVLEVCYKVEVHGRNVKNPCHVREGPRLLSQHSKNGSPEYFE